MKLKEMTTNVYLNGKKINVLISEEKSRKDFVVWFGFTLLDVYKSMDKAKEAIILLLKEAEVTGDIEFN